MIHVISGCVPISDRVRYTSIFLTEHAVARGTRRFLLFLLFSFTLFSPVLYFFLSLF